MALVGCSVVPVVVLVVQVGLSGVPVVSFLRRALGGYLVGPVVVLAVQAGLCDVPVSRFLPVVVTGVAGVVRYSVVGVVRCSTWVSAVLEWL